MKNTPTIYLDTNILSSLYLPPSGVQSHYRRTATRDWWENERKHFRLFASILTESELRAGKYRGQAQAVAACRRLAYLRSSKKVIACASFYLDKRLVPPEKPADALQLALATVHKVDYLLTWNYAHLANVDTQRRLRTMNDAQGWLTPLLVSPENIPQVRLGQQICRPSYE